ncbi:MAG: response regulator, partial [Deinococcales bacterium]
MPTWTILLADPDPLQRQLVDMLLAQEAFQIVNAGNGRDTLEYLKEHTPHLAILALELPDVGGDVICRKLKAVKRLSNVPVILTTKPPGEGGLST